MKPIVRRSSSLLAALALTTSLTLPHLPAAYAAPGTSPAIGWTQLGLSNQLELVGANQAYDVSLPVPQEVTPARLTGQIGSVVNTAGRIDIVDSRGIVIANVPIPADLQTAPFNVDISKAEVVNGVARLSFRIRDYNNARVDSCVQAAAVTLGQLAATYSGESPDPATIADFLPGYLDRVTVHVGPEPSLDQQQAALDLVAKLTQLYRPMPVRIDIDTSAAPPSNGTGSERTIVIRETDTPGLTVERPGTRDAVLVVSGTGPELQQQVELFADRRFGLAQTPSAAVLTATEQRAQLTNIKTFEQLGMTGQTSVLGAATMYAGFDVSAFGVGSITEAIVHLKARYTPVVGGEATVVIRSGSAVLATQKLDESGVLDITGTIPAESITTNVGMAIELRYVPRQECAPLNDRITFTLDPQSTVTVTPGNRNRGGFPALPMAFNPDFEVVVDDPSHLDFAAQAINLMGQQSTVALQPRVTSFDEAAQSGIGLLAVSAGPRLTEAGMNPPMTPTSENEVDVQGSPETNVDLGGAVGVVQAFTHNNRTVLAVSGTGDWSLVNDSFNHIRGLPGRWASLTGDVVATGPAGDSMNLTVREGGAMVNEYPGDGWKWWAWVSLSLGAAAVLGAVAWVIVRRRAAR
ncbi:MAG: hypothetical protein WBB07_03280 [Mycobacterium sp.]